MLRGQLFTNYVLRQENYTPMKDYIVAQDLKECAREKYSRNEFLVKGVPRIFLYESNFDGENTNDLIVSCHEACHFLNNQKDVGAVKRLKFFEKLYKATFLFALLPGIVWACLYLLGNSSSLHIFLAIIVIIFGITGTCLFTLSYRKDEISTEILAKEMVEKHLDSAFKFYGDNRTYLQLKDEINNIFNERMNKDIKEATVTRGIWGVFLVVINLFLFFNWI
ncbi:hypothetical protein P4V05_20630 [Bacillus thuringiensis]|nr:hypothetical protein [Bacillus thuringiensis]